MDWANALLIRAFKLEQANDIFKVVEVGRIDFDFCKPDPDESCLKIFFEKQYNGAQLPYAEYQY